MVTIWFNANSCILCMCTHEHTEQHFASTHPRMADLEDLLAMLVLEMSVFKSISEGIVGTGDLGGLQL